MYYFVTVLKLEDNRQVYLNVYGDHDNKANAILDLRKMGVILSFIELTKEEYDIIAQSEQG